MSSSSTSARNPTSGRWKKTSADTRRIRVLEFGAVALDKLCVLETRDERPCAILAEMVIDQMEAARLLTRQCGHVNLPRPWLPAAPVYGLHT